MTRQTDSQVVIKVLWLPKVSTICRYIIKIYYKNCHKLFLFLRTCICMDSKRQHCVKSVQIRSFSGPYFPVFGLNTQIYSINFRIESEYEKIRTRKSSIFGHFSCSARNIFTLQKIDILSLFSWRYKDLPSHPLTSIWV